MEDRFKTQQKPTEDFQKEVAAYLYKSPGKLKQLLERTLFKEFEERELEALLLVMMSKRWLAKEGDIYYTREAFAMSETMKVFGLHKSKTKPTDIIEFNKGTGKNKRTRTWRPSEKQIYERVLDPARHPEDFEKMYILVEVLKAHKKVIIAPYLDNNNKRAKAITAFKKQYRLIGSQR